MAKYIIDIPEEVKNIQGIVQDYGIVPVNLIPYTEPDRKAIENEVWEFVVKCLKMDGDDFYEIFNSCDVMCLTNFSYQEAKAKYDAWRKQKDEIGVGDEVEIANTIGVVTRVPKYDEQRVHYITESGTVYCNNAYAEIKKTGRHFDEVEELLKKMRDEQDD